MSPSLEHFVGEERIPIFGGRFQPMHLGHVSMVRLLLNKFDYLYLGIVNPDPSNPSHPEYERFDQRLNPFTFWERHTHFSALLDSEGWHGRVRIVPMWHPRKALSREENFLPPRRKRFWVVPGIDDSELAKIEDKKQLGEEVVDIASYLADPDLKYRSTSIRQQIERGALEWETAVTHSMVPLLQNLRRSGSYLISSAPTRWTILASTWALVHSGHVNVIRSLVTRDGLLIVGILSPERKSDDRKCGCIKEIPFSFRERMEMIIAACAEVGILDRIRIIPIYEGRGGHRAQLFNEAFLPANRRWAFTSCDIVNSSELHQLKFSGEDVEIIAQDVRTDEVSRLLAHDGAISEIIPASVVRYLKTVGGLDRLAAAQSPVSDEHQTAFEPQTVASSQPVTRNPVARLDFLRNYPPRVGVNGTELTLPSNRYYAIILLLAENYTADKSAARTHAELLMPLAEMLESLPKRAALRLSGEDERFVDDCKAAHRIASNTKTPAKPKTPISNVLSDLRRYLNKIQHEPVQDDKTAAASFLLGCIPAPGNEFKLKKVSKTGVNPPDQPRLSS